jgi:alpha-mannosidase
MSTLHIVPHTHWDREWYLPFQSFRIKLVHLIDVLLDLLEEDFRYVHFTLDGQAIILEDYLEIRPEREADLIRNVRSNRLVIGPWYTLPDEFLVSPEAIVRNLLRGQAICARFGTRMDIGYLPDPFGHIGQMPQILRGFDIDAAVLRRGLADEQCELYWQSPNGSQILLIYLRDGYDNAARLPTDPAGFGQFIREARDSLIPHTQTSHLLLMNGTDHHEPQPELAALIAITRLDEDAINISTLPNFVRAVRKEVEAKEIPLPLIQGELRDPKRHHLLPGVLSGRVWIKQRNHTCETLLERWAEPFTAWTELFLQSPSLKTVWTGHLQTPYVSHPKSLLNEAWRILLQCHPHDSICGCSIDQVHEEMRPRFDQVEQIGEEIVHQSLVTLAEAVDTSPLNGVGARASIVVFNPFTKSKSDIAEVELELMAGLDPFEIVDDKGNSVPYQLLDRKSRSLVDMTLDADGLRSMMMIVQDGRVLGLSLQTVAILKYPDHALIDIVLAEGAEPNKEAVRRGGEEVEALLKDGRFKEYRIVGRFATEATIRFIAADVPGHGLRSFGLHPSIQASHESMFDEGRVIENEFIHVELRHDGTLTLSDLRSGVVFPDLLLFSDQGDRGDSYTFCPMEGTEAILSSCVVHTSRRLIHSCGQTLEIRSSLKIPQRILGNRSARSETLVTLPIRILVSILPDAPRVDLDIQIENTAQDHRLQVLFPLPFQPSSAFFDGHFETVERELTLPAFDFDWIEHPVIEKPMRNFVLARQDDYGLLVASRGLREAAVSAEGSIAITLVRSYGWLSRDDLATRKGGAGPQLPTPAGQSQGEHTFHLSLIPFGQDHHAAQDEALGFQSRFRGVGTKIHPGSLPPMVSLLSIEPQTFQITAIKVAEDGQSLIVRGVNLQQVRSLVRIGSAFPVRSASKARLDETPIEDIQVHENHCLEIEVHSFEILTVRLDPLLGEVYAPRLPEKRKSGISDPSTPEKVPSPPYHP